MYYMQHALAGAGALALTQALNGQCNAVTVTANAGG
jgi:hypothetical protein